MSSDMMKPIQGNGIGYPGITYEIDSPFRIADGIPLRGGLIESHALLDGAYEMLRRVAEDKKTDESLGVELKGIGFLLLSALSMISSLERGFGGHALATGPDGWNVHPNDAPGQPRESDQDE